MLTYRNNTNGKRREGTVNKDQRVTVWDVAQLDRTLWAKAEASQDRQWSLLAAHEAGRMSMLRSVMREDASDSDQWEYTVAYRSAQDFITDMEEGA